MITANDLRPRSTFEYEGQIYRTLTKTSTHMGRGSATVRVKLRNLRSGATIDRTFSPDVRLEDIRLETREVQYLYNEDGLYYFMDMETYEQPAVAELQVQDYKSYLAENMMLEIDFYDTEPIDIVLPANVDLEVIYTEQGIAGDTAQGAKKPAEVETGLVVQVPLFVNMGNVIRVKTETGEYVTRVS